MLQSQECDVIHIQTPSQTCSNKLVANNLVNVPEKQCPMMFIVLLGFAIMAPLAPNLAFILEYSQVLGTVRAQYLVYMWALGTAVGSALGLNVGALLGVWLFSRLNTWSTSDPPPFLLTTNRLHLGRGTATNDLVPKHLHKTNTASYQYLVRISSP